MAEVVENETSSAGSNRVLSRMLERLFASLVSGPSLNCRPHSSRQRIDLTALARLRDEEPHEVLLALLGEDRKAKVGAKVPAPRGAAGKKPAASDDSEIEEDTVPVDTPSARQLMALQAYVDQTALLNKLRIIAEDARTYEQDTGVHVLNIGFPLLTLPPGAFAGGSRSAGVSRRVVAPIAFIPVTLTVKRGATQSVEIECHGDGIDLVTPNAALLAWLEQQTGKPAFAELFADEEGENPWREICELVRRVCVLLEMPVPGLFSTEPAVAEDGEEPAEKAEGSRQKAEVRPPESLRLIPAPRADEDEESGARILNSAVMGLYPVANQGLLRDLQAMVSGEDEEGEAVSLAGPIEAFIRAGAALDRVPEEHHPEQIVRGKRVFTEERLVAPADPCQARAVKLARQCRGLVIHGPPGTGKSQTITNIIGDHLSRGERVLLVCDKRTALDVVANRLEHMGLGQLCAVVHDPQRDQRELYKMIREQLDALPEATTNPKAENRLAKIDEELQELHGKLTAHWAALMMPPASGGMSFHELMGQWLGIDAPRGVRLNEAGLRETRLGALESHDEAVREALRRGQEVTYPTNPWTSAAGTSVREFVARPMSEVREKMNACLQSAQAADATLDPAIPAFVPEIDLTQQVEQREALANLAEKVRAEVDPVIGARWAGGSEEIVRRGAQRLRDLADALKHFRETRLDHDLSSVVRSDLPSPATVGQQVVVLDEYLAIAGKWYGFISFSKNKAAGHVMQRYGLARSAENARRLRAFLDALRTRLSLQSALNEHFSAQAERGLATDEVMDKAFAGHAAVLELLAHVSSTPGLAALYERTATALTDTETAASFIHGLQKSRERAEAVLALDACAADVRLFTDEWLKAQSVHGRLNKPCAEVIDGFAQRLDSLESVLRTRELLAALPAPLRGATEELLNQHAAPEEGLALLRKTLLAGEITRRLSEDPTLHSIDTTAIETAFERYRRLDEQKKGFMREMILHQWTSRQKERLLAGTGSRLNGAGADLKRRLTLRGERAMRLRQVIAVGAAGSAGAASAADANGESEPAAAEAAPTASEASTPSNENRESKIEHSLDPLFDVCPVWLASPETVAQVFPRKPVFDVVVFDEASQCRLEEALPILTRGGRVVIAGDPKQLPPTRFFESAVAQSDDDEIENEQALFEQQQSEVEDLLGAALNLEIEQCYLDVHYRSRNADLIEFSNRYFYNSRLQAIPGHPSKLARTAPLTVHRVDGTYEKRTNVAEAEKVAELVRDLLKQKKPPSIGIACFNVNQRDLIGEVLDELAAEDADFGRRLAEARVRTGSGSFEGLFVKNLENVQGDERDHILISTTYGPDSKGRFYRRFGPLGRAGGARRLNVLVTRARQHVHLITSIPEEAYRSLPPVPPNQSPTGSYLLFAYLKYAEEVAGSYNSGAETTAAESASLSIEGEGEEQRAPAPEPGVKIRSSRYPSTFAEALAKNLLAAHQVGSDVQWGNDGFSIDLALHPAHQPEAPTLGLLVDGSRFAQADDPVEWDIFRTAIHESQGWRLHRLWTPHFFRDPEGAVRAILAKCDTPRG